MSYSTPYARGGGGKYYQNDEENQQQYSTRASTTTRRSRAENNNDGWKSILQSQRASQGQIFNPHVPSVNLGSTSASAAPTTTTTTTTTTAAAPATTTTSSASTTTSNKSSALTGTIVNALTPFDSTGAVDLRLIGEYAAAIKADGVKGVLCCSPTVGEGLTLSIAEQETVISAWCRANVGPVAVWINQGGPSGAALVQAAQRAGASCVVIGSANVDEATAADAARFVSSVIRGSSLSFLVSIPSSLVGSAADEFITAVARLDGFRGVVASRLCHVIAASNAAANSSIVFASSNLDDDLQVISAAAEGATAFISDHSSVVAPLMNRIFAAGAKGDNATATKMGKLFAQYLSGFPSRPSLHVAALKSLLALRLDLPQDAVEVRPPTPTLSAADSSRLKQKMEQFVKNYVSAVGNAPAPAAAAAASTTPNVLAMPGYRGQLNELIIRRIEHCERLCGKSNMVSLFPHLRYPDGSWRTRRPGNSPAQYIDHTVLKPECTEAEIVKLVQEAKANNFFAVCVNGSRAARCVELTRGSNVAVAAVIGFPLGAGTIRAKAEEAGELVHEIGCKEIDMVMNIGAFKDKNYRHVYEDIKAVVRASSPAIVKVIFETCLLNQEEIIDASILSVFAGAQFIKTSTGFNKGGATPEAIDVMLAVAGNESDVKASGGVKDFAAAMAYIQAGVMRIGTSSGVAIIAGKPAGAGY